MPVLTADYSPHFWQKNNHLSTIYASVARKVPDLEQERERLILSMVTIWIWIGPLGQARTKSSSSFSMVWRAMPNGLTYGERPKHFTLGDMMSVP